MRDHPPVGDQHDIYQTRFGGVARLLSEAGLERLRTARVAVIGLGGVGSWTVEALARSGVGHLTLVDLDEICVTNTNRQIHALEPGFGKPKAGELAARARAINPEIDADAVLQFYSQANSEELLARDFDCVVDAIDNGNTKAHLLDACREHGIPAVTCGGAGGRKDPTKIRVADLSRTYNDALLHLVRRKLRQVYGFPRGKRKFGVPTIFSEENIAYTWSDGTICAQREPGGGGGVNCNSGLGTAAWVTGAFGLAMAGEVVKLLTASLEETGDQNSA